MSMFPFRDPKSDRMQRRVVSMIQQPNFIFELPSLSPASWDIILNDSRERERLEFLGDALIGASISEELFRCWPNEGPGFYTIARSVLTANSTFAHIMQKLGFHSYDQPVKPTGDAFETIFAAYHSERGPDAFNQYVRQSFSPLIKCVGHTYHDRRANELHARKIRIQRQQNQHMMSTAAVLQGNSKIHRRLKQSNKLNNMKKPLRREVSQRSTYRFQVPIRGNPVISGPNSSCKIFAKTTMQHRVIVDLTSDSDEGESIVEIQPTSVPKPRGSVGKPKVDFNHVPPSHSAKIKPTGETRSHSILRFVSVSPQKCRTTGTKSSLTDPRRSKKVDQDDLVALFSQTSLKNLPGSFTNPITIDD